MQKRALLFQAISLIVAGTSCGESGSAPEGSGGASAGSSTGTGSAGTTSSRGGGSSSGGQGSGGAGGPVGAGTAGSAGAVGGADTGGVGMSGADAGGSGNASGSAGTSAGSGAGGTGTAGTAPMNGGAGAGAGGTAGNAAVACTITASPAKSSAIPTVGIVEWSTDLQGVDGAYIDFGLDTDYGMRAPVDLGEPSYRTLLLGMKGSRTYHFRIVASAGTNECTSQDFTVDTGPIANGLIDVDVTTNDAARLAGGFLITGQYVQGGGASGSPAYVLDSDGDIVWWFNIGSDVTGARMSYDGKYMWINSANVPQNQGANVHRVSMDGLIDEDLSDQFVGQNHQLTVLPDETVAFYTWSEDGCADIKLRRADGSIETVIGAGEAHGAPGDCWVNMIEYSEDDDTLIFSDRNHNNLTKITLDGEVVWVLGGTTSDFTGDGTSFLGQHGVDVLGENRILIFNNNVASMGAGGDSLALEVLLDRSAMSATRAWTYSAMPPLSNIVMGDVQRLPNGNTVVAYSTQGILHEVSADGEVLQELSWPLGGAFGYIQKRQTLYGPPPR